MGIGEVSELEGRLVICVSRKLTFTELGSSETQWEASGVRLGRLKTSQIFIWKEIHYCC